MTCVDTCVVPLRLGEIGGLESGVAGAVKDSLGPGFEMSTLEFDRVGGAEPAIYILLFSTNLQTKEIFKHLIIQPLLIFLSNYRSDSCHYVSSFFNLTKIKN